MRGQPEFWIRIEVSAFYAVLMKSRLFNLLFRCGIAVDALEAQGSKRQVQLVILGSR